MKAEALPRAVLKTACSLLRRIFNRQVISDCFIRSHSPGQAAGNALTARFKLALHLALPLALLAGTGQLAAQQFTITVRQVAADNSGGGVDPELADVKKDLGSLNYNTFRLKKTVKIQCGLAEEKTLELLGDNRLTLQPQGYQDGRIRLKVKLSPADSKDRGMDTVLRIPDGGTFLIGGPSYGEGVLILAFTASR
ncbi:MAG: hypothetical protein JXQ83_11630 [Candidatus Glassbacteria bacterium]|nr:hypothetical protein [Candidatus Glassbacteria bacterium]